MRRVGYPFAAVVLAVGALTLGWPWGEIGMRTTSAQQADPSPAGRSHRGLIALYDFSSTSGNFVRDRSGVGVPVDLRIADTKSVRRARGELVVQAKTQIRSEKPASKIIDAIRSSDEITVEAWLRPANNRQDGPARVVTLSKNTNERNLTLGQEGNKFDVRLRTTGTSRNGMPSLATAGGSLKTSQTHVVYTRERGGRARIYLNGAKVVDRSTPGSLKNWDGSLRLGLANEATNDRPWLGTYYLVALYDRRLSDAEVAQNFRAGCAADAVQELLAKAKLARSAELFNANIASLFVEHCFECHDAATQKGGLDISRKVSALAGGENGKAIVPKQLSKSLIWQHVASDEMPKKRAPLSRESKQHLREWIESGAVWTLDVIDPELYAHDRRAAGVVLQRLTVDEYIQTVHDSVGINIAQEARQRLPGDLRADGFSNTAYNLNVDLKHVEAYARLAEIIVGRMDVSAFAARFTKSDKPTDDNLRRLVDKMGKWLLRGPLIEQEADEFRGIAAAVIRAGGEFEETASYLVEAMLQSPRFVYRMERQRGDGRIRQADDYEIASRLSYIIWGGPPDRELMAAADRRDFGDRAKTAAQVERMLADPRAVERSRQFLSQWLDLGRLKYLKPDRKHFPHWDSRLADDMREESLAFFTEVAWVQKRPLSELFNAQITFATPRLARHYGLALPASNAKQNSGQPDGATRYDLSSVPSRGGLLTQASVLTIGGDEASMVTRGLFVLRDVLRGSVKDPPPCVDTTPVPTKAGRTQRAIAEARIANNNCGGCHVKFEPLAFGLERFDGLGVYHERDEHGNRLRHDGEILVPATNKPLPYRSAAELMDLLANSDRVRQTITWKLTQFALGRPLVATDAASLAKIHESAWQQGGTYASLVKAIVTSELVLQTRTELDP